MKRLLLVVLSPATLAAAPVTRIEPAPPLPKAETYGDWTVKYLSATSTIASVSNDAGSIFGTICDQTECTAFFNPTIECEDGQSYPALVNAPAAAFTVTLKCEKVDDLFLYSIPLEGGVTEAMSVGGVLGIAFPMASGQFKVVRFSLTGAARATARASQLVNGATPPVRQEAKDELTL